MGYLRKNSASRNSGVYHRLSQPGKRVFYIADANLVGRWLLMLTGDHSHWKYIIHETFAGQNKDGLLKDAIFSGVRRSLVDFMLLGVIGVKDYYLHTLDLDTVRSVLPGCRKVIEWFQRLANKEGLFALAWEDMPKAAGFVEKGKSENDELPWGLNLFIDHAGLGWHNKNEPGIDRQGLNTGINALWVMALLAQAELERLVGNMSTAEWMSNTSQEGG